MADESDDDDVDDVDDVDGVDGDDPFDYDNEDDPLVSEDDEAGDPDDAGEIEDMSTDASVQERAETAKDKMRKGRKVKEVREEPTKPVLARTKGVKAAKKAVTAPKTGKKAPAAPKKAAPAPKAPATQPRRSAAAKGKADPDRVFLMRGPAILLRQIGDPTRAAVIDLLADGPMNVGQICVALGGLSQPAVSHHLALLRHGRIISPTRQGKNNVYDLESVGRDLARIIRTLSASA